MRWECAESNSTWHGMVMKVVGGRWWALRLGRYLGDSLFCPRTSLLSVFFFLVRKMSTEGWKEGK